jgi:drug/metabolite transporter (DMT)-like permease
MNPDPPTPRPAAWTLTLAFALVYLSWGTTYLAIKEGVKTLPPALFGGSRITLAGLVLLGYLVVRGDSLRLPRREWLATAVIGLLLFVCGNGLVSVALLHIERSEASIVASILVATTPLWTALLEGSWPGGDRLRGVGWAGLLLGLTGVLVLLGPKLRDPAKLLSNFGPLLVLGSSFGWALASVLMRHRRQRVAHLVSAAYQMILGGGVLALIGLAVGEAEQLSVDSFTPASVYAFFHLLVFGSLVGFLSYNWLLGHVSAPLASTYAYVNPLVAILVGWLIGGEEPTVWALIGLVVILAGVALVRGGMVRPRPAATVCQSVGESSHDVPPLPARVRPGVDIGPLTGPRR